MYWAVNYDQTHGPEQNGKATIIYIIYFVLISQIRKKNT